MQNGKRHNAELVGHKAGRPIFAVSLKADNARLAAHDAMIGELVGHTAGRPIFAVSTACVAQGTKHRGELIGHIQGKPLYAVADNCGYGSYGSGAAGRKIHLKVNPPCLCFEMGRELCVTIQANNPLFFPFGTFKFTMVYDDVSKTWKYHDCVCFGGLFTEITAEIVCQMPFFPYGAGIIVHYRPMALSVMNMITTNYLNIWSILPGPEYIDYANFQHWEQSVIDEDDNVVIITGGGSWTCNPFDGYARDGQHIPVYHVQDATDEPCDPVPDYTCPPFPAIPDFWAIDFSLGSGTLGGFKVIQWDEVENVGLYDGIVWSTTGMYRRHGCYYGLPAQHVEYTGGMWRLTVFFGQRHEHGTITIESARFVSGTNFSPCQNINFYFDGGSTDVYIQSRGSLARLATSEDYLVLGATCGVAPVLACNYPQYVTIRLDSDCSLLDGAVVELPNTVLDHFNDPFNGFNTERVIYFLITNISGYDVWLSVYLDNYTGLWKSGIYMTSPVGNANPDSGVATALGPLIGCDLTSLTFNQATVSDSSSPASLGPPFTTTCGGVAHVTTVILGTTP